MNRAAETKVPAREKLISRDRTSLQMTQRNRLVSIVGPTASGKTEFATRLAEALHTEIISADSRQFYREMDIGTAKPAADDLRRVPHHFIAHLGIDTLYSAGDFERDALAVLDHLFHSHRVVVMVGGSGLYIKAVTEGFDEMPRADEELRRYLRELFEKEGKEALQEMLKSLDEKAAENIDMENTQRLMRAIELAKQGKREPLVPREPRNFVTITIGMQLERAELYERINRRVDQMMEMGLLDEAKSLYPRRDLNALHTVGYTELFEYFDEKIDLARAVELIKQHTRNYAKRQMTWFRKQPGIVWLRPDDVQAAIDLVHSQDQTK
jgi:tRNA dimethylallyltransferase